MIGLALEEPVKHLEKAVHQAHDWLCSNPPPWDPKRLAHPSDPLNPFSVSHSAISTSVHMPPRTRPVYQHPRPLPGQALKKPVQARVRKYTTSQSPRAKKLQTPVQPRIRTTPSPLPAIPRPPQHSRPRPPEERHRSPQTHQTTIVWALPKRAKTALPLPPPSSKARYRHTRLPLPSRPTATTCPGPSAPAPPHSNASQDIQNFFRPSSDLLSPPLNPFSPLPPPETPPLPHRVNQRSSNLTIRATVYIS